MLTFNQWSGTDYNNNLTGIYGSTGITLTSSNDWSSNGDKSFKVENTLSNTLLISLPSVSVNKDDNVYFSFDCQLSKPILVVLQQKDTNNTTIHSQNVTVPSTNQNTAILSTSILDNVSSLVIQIYVNGNSVSYLDNFKLNKR